MRVGDLYAVLGDDSRNQRIKLKFPRAIKLDHLAAADTLLVTAYDSVFVLPNTPDGASGVIKQPDCETGCFKNLITRKQLPIVIFPGFNSARDRHAGLQARIFAWIGELLFSGAGDDAQSVSISIAYVETYGLPNLQASGLLYNDYCNDTRGRLICDERVIRDQLSMVAGTSAKEKVVNSTLYKYNVYLVLVSTVYLTRSLKYSFSADSSAGVRAEAYKQILKAAQDAPVAPASAGGAAPGATPPTATAGADSRATTEAAQNALARQRQQILAAIEKAGSDPGGALEMEDAASNRVVIDLPLPRPVAIGFIPVIKEFTSSAANVVEPE